jgi:MFS family permease
VLFAALYSYLLKVVPKERMGRSLSLFYGAFNVGIIAGAPLGGLLARFGLAVPLYAYAGILFLAGGLYLKYVPDPAPVEKGPDAPPVPIRPFGERLRALLTDRTFVVIIFLNFTYLWFVAAALDTLVPLFGNEALGLSAGGVGLAFSVLVAVEFAVLYHAGHLSDRFGRKAVELPALVGLCAVVAITGLVGNVLWYVIVLGLMGIASGYAGVPPGAMLADVAPPESSGTAVGAFRFAGDLGFVLAPLAAGRAVEAFGFGGAFAVIAIPSVVAALFLLGIPETLKRPNVATAAA